MSYMVWEEEQTCLNKIEISAKSRTRGLEPSQNHSNFEDKDNMDENHMPTLADSVHSDSDVELYKDYWEVTSTIDPTYADNINSEL